MKVVHRQQYEAIQYTTYKELKAFLRFSYVLVSKRGKNALVNGILVYPGDWIVAHPEPRVLSDVQFKEHYQPADALDLSVAHAVGLQSKLYALETRIEEISLTEEEKTFLYEADIRSSERQEKSSQLKKSIIKKLC